MGSNATYPFTVSQLYGFSSSVALSVSSTKNSSALLIRTTSKTPAGTYNMTVSGTSGKIVRTMYVTLIVVSPPSFTQSVSTASQTVTRGSAATCNIDLTPTANFTSNVSLSVSGVPSRATATFSPKLATDSSTLTINTTPTTPRGTFKLTITGVGGGVTCKTTVTLIVK
jgi:hypothetical protein